MIVFILGFVSFVFFGYLVFVGGFVLNMFFLFYGIKLCFNLDILSNKKYIWGDEFIWWEVLDLWIVIIVVVVLWDWGGMEIKWKLSRWRGVYVVCGVFFDVCCCCFVEFVCVWCLSNEFWGEFWFCRYGVIYWNFFLVDVFLMFYLFLFWMWMIGDGCWWNLFFCFFF